MNDIQKKKRNFRNSKKWKEFRKKKMLEQKNLDPITETKLSGRFALHHKNLNAENYEDISKEDDFIAILKETHDSIHWMLRYIKKYKDLRVLDNFYNEVVNEAKRNGFID